MSDAVERIWRDMWETWRGDWRLVVRYALFVPFRKQTYRNVAYLIFGLPLGIGYLSVLTIGLVVGLVTTPVLVGFPILLVVVVVANWANSFERELASIWLGIDIPPPFPTAREGSGIRQRVMGYLRDQVTWTNLLYLILKTPIFGLTFFAAFSGLNWAAELFATPIVGTVNPAFSGGMSNLEQAVRVSFAVVVIGAVLHALNLLAYLSGRLARFMLGPSDAAIRLVASEAATVQARQNEARAERSRQELMVNVSHELRTPVASIRGHVESLMIAVERDQTDGRPEMPADQFHNYLGIIHRETERLGALVDDLLALARSEAGELRLIPRPIQPESVVQEVHETLAPLAWKDRSVTVIADYEPGVPIVLADRDRLVQVMLNLVRNAITHTPPGGIVSMGVTRMDDYGRPDPTYVTLSVSDTGTGIPPEDLERIFERFYRVDASRNRSSGGFGLGLSIVKDLVTAMGGTVSVESRVDEGSRFVVRLKIADRATNGSRPTSQPASPTAPRAMVDGEVAPVGRR